MTITFPTFPTPSYSSMIYIGDFAGTTYTAPSNGYIIFSRSIWDNSPINIYVNGIHIYSGAINAKYQGGSLPFTIPMRQGDYVSFAEGNANAVFIPLS